jgi:hypothetical protein
MDFWGGSSWYSQSSADNLIRDATWRTGMHIDPNHIVLGFKNNSYANFESIFDVPGQDDPRCTNGTPYF